MSNDTRSRPMTTETIHTCSYSCERPGCIRAQRDELAAKVEALRAEVEKLRADRDSWEQQASDRVADWHAEHLRAERLAEALRVAREYVVSELAAERDKFAGYEHCSNIASIEADIAKIDAALAKENRND